ncbi:ATP-dependent Clp protease ATP-binding subunit ClpX [Anaerostipes faecis]|uniref:ATP-dependent Clp protease ATP-binding subunit ClpX n=1 Tax=Anaerostipes faecis TaxID=2880702 RepID=UPI0011DCF350|nr:ATP-dependent Clp protease ATP-binding subunit ClpX [Anaerostipes faecis]
MSEEINETELEEKEVPAKTTEEKDETHDVERYCYLCRRPESITGKMITLPKDIHICVDCMQRTMDSMGNGQFGFIDATNMDLNNMDLSHLMENMQEPPAQAVKKKDKKKKKKEKKELNLRDIPAPHKIKAMLDEYVIGQDYAKKVMSVAVYNHYKRVVTNTMEEIEIDKSNMLMVGPTGSGKTYLVRTLARLLQVPLAITDATSLTEAGYIGDDVESVLSKLLQAADNDVDEAEHGIIFIDEIDKIAKKQNTNSRDVSGESVQQGLLKLLEGAEVEVPVGATSKNAMVPMTTINTKNILFICGGAFPDLDEIIKKRLMKQTSIGFHADLKDKFDKDENILSRVTVDDLREYGMIPEFLGRLPMVFTLEGLSKDMLVRILKEPKNAILKQYQKLLELDEVELIFDESALEAIAEKALEKKTGARALRAIIEKFMLDIMFEIPKDDTIGRVIINRDYILNHGTPVIELRGQ